MAKRKTSGRTAKAAPPKARPRAKANGGSDGDVDSAALQKIFEDAGMGEKTGGGLKYVDVECPYCGEEFEVRVDAGEESFEMAEECRGCSKMVSFSVTIEDGEVSVSAYQS
jgi:hypothetical protein